MKPTYLNTLLRILTLLTFFGPMAFSADSEPIGSTLELTETDLLEPAIETPIFLDYDFLPEQYTPQFSMGTKDGGGGDVVECQDGKFYSLDYLQTQVEPNNISEKLLQAKDYKVLRLELYERLSRVNGAIAESFWSVSRMESDPTGFVRGRFWIPGSNRLIDITDEDFRRIPTWCLQSSDLEELKRRLHQAVIRRVAENNLITYEFDQILFQKMDPIQKSFLVAHEWLQDFTESRIAIMQASRFFHTDKVIEEDYFSIFYGLETAFGLEIPVFHEAKYALRSPKDGKDHPGIEIRRNQDYLDSSAVSVQLIPLTFEHKVDSEYKIKVGVNRQIVELSEGFESDHLFYSATGVTKAKIDLLNQRGEVVDSVEKNLYTRANLHEIIVDNGRTLGYTIRLQNAGNIIFQDGERRIPIKGCYLASGDCLKKDIVIVLTDFFEKN